MNTPLSRCDDCYAQVEPMNWYGHRMWHKDQEDALNQVQDQLENIHDCDCDDTRPDVTKLEEQMQDVFNWVENEIFPRLEKIEGLAAIFNAVSEKQLFNKT
jgi:septation ring formation regulator EzrA